MIDFGGGMYFINKLKINKEIIGVVIFMVSTFFQRGLGLITTPIFTRILTSYDYGIVSTYNTWSGVLSVIFTLSIAANVFNTGLIKFKDERNQFVSSMIGLTFILVCFGFFLISCFKTKITSITGLEYKYYILLFTNMFFNVVYGFWGLCAKFDGKYINVVIVNLIISIISIFISIISIVKINYDTAFIKIFMESLPSNIFALGLIFYFLCKSKCIFIKKYWEYVLLFCIPLIPHYMSNHLLNQADRIMITSICGADKTGIYTIAYKIPEILNILWSCISAVFIPWLYKKLDKNESIEVRKFNNILLIGVSVVTFGTILSGPEVIQVLSPEEYWEGKYLIPPLIIGYSGLFVCLICSHIELFYKKNYFITFITVVAAMINIFLNYFLIPKYGYMIAAFTTYICYFIMLVLHMFNIRRLKLNVFIDLKLAFIMFIFNTLNGMIMLFFYDKILIRYTILSVLGIICSFKYKKIIEFFKKIKKINS